MKRWRSWPQTRRAAVLSLMASLLAGFWAYRLFGPLSPEAIRNRAIYALENGDAQALCQLADKEELSRLHLTPAVVSGFLHETLWRKGAPQEVHVEKLDRTPVDQAVWRVAWRNDPPARPKVCITVIDDPEKGWKMSLSKLLWDTCWWDRGGKEGMRTYVELAQKHGISGLRGQEGNYIPMEILASKVAEIFAGTTDSR